MIFRLAILIVAFITGALAPPPQSPPSSPSPATITLTNVISARGLYSDVRKFRDVLIVLNGWCHIQIKRDGFAVTEVYTHSPPHTETVLDPSCEWEAFQSPVDNHVYIYQLDPVDHRLRIFDMGLETTISTAITKVADLGGYNSYKLVVDYYHTVAFFVGPNFADIMDLSNPIAPTLITRVTTGVNAVQSIFLYKNHLYISGIDAGLRRINLNSVSYAVQTVVAAGPGTSFAQIAVSDSLIVANGQESYTSKSMIIDSTNFAVYSSSAGSYRLVSFLNDTRIIRAVNVPPQTSYEEGLDIHDISDKTNPVLKARTPGSINFGYVPKFYWLSNLLFVPSYWYLDVLALGTLHPTAATEFAAEHSNNIGYFENPLVVSGTLSAQVSSSGNYAPVSSTMLTVSDKRAQYAFATITLTVVSNSLSSNIVQKQVNNVWTIVPVGSNFTQVMVTAGQVRILITDNGAITLSASQLGASISAIVLQVSVTSVSSSVALSSSLLASSSALRVSSSAPAVSSSRLLSSSSLILPSTSRMDLSSIQFLTSLVRSTSTTSAVVPSSSSMSLSALKSAVSASSRQTLYSSSPSVSVGSPFITGIQASSTFSADSLSQIISRSVSGNIRSTSTNPVSVDSAVAGLSSSTGYSVLSHTSLYGGATSSVLSSSSSIAAGRGKENLKEESVLAAIVSRVKLNWGFVTVGAISVVVLVGGAYKFGSRKNKKGTDDNQTTTSTNSSSSTTFPVSQITFDSTDGSTQVGTQITQSATGRFTLVDRDNSGLALPGYMEYTDGLHYRRMEKIAAGGMGAIFFAQPLHPKIGRSSDKVVVKVLNDKMVSVDMFHQEVAIMASLTNYRNFGQILGYCEQPMSILMRFYALGDLKAFVLSKSQVKTKRMLSHFLYDIAVGLMLMHRKGLVHSDIKPENILLDRAADGRIFCAISDFGITRIANDKSLAVKDFHVIEINGRSVHYCPPELFLKAWTPEGQIFMADVYAYGVLVNFILTRSKTWGKE